MGEKIFQDPYETVVPMTGVERTHFAAMKTLKRNFAVASGRLRDVSIPVEFLQKQKEAGNRFTFAVLVIRAVGMALDKHPRLGWMRRGWKIVKPSTSDVGCSVGTESPVSPVVVIRDAGKKNLDLVREELAELAKQARATEEEELSKIEKAARLMPIGWLFRIIVWFVMTWQKFLRHTVGNFQVTVLNNSNLDFGITSMTGATTLMMGRIKNRALVVDGEVQARPAAYFCLHFDHALHGARDGALFMEEFYRLLDHPEELL